MKNKLSTTILSRSQYLAAANGDAEAALTRALNDANDLYTEASDLEAEGSIRARNIVTALTPLTEFLGIDINTIVKPGVKPTEEAISTLTQAVQETMEDLSDLSESRDSWMQLAAEAGLDIEALQNAEDDAQAEILDGWLNGLQGTSDTAQQELNVYKFAHAHGLNPEAVLLQKGLEGLTEVEVKSTGEDGKEKTEKVWSVPGAKEGEFKAATEHLAPVIGALKGTTESKPAGVTWISGQEGKPAAGGSAYDAYLKAKADASKQQPGTDPLQPRAAAQTTTKGV